MTEAIDREEQALVWGLYKPRHTHAWNMLVTSWRELDAIEDSTVTDGFITEYRWENFILRLWLYRTTVSTLTKLNSVKLAAKQILQTFDAEFICEGQNSLRAIRNMLEHFDDYAAGAGRGPASREHDLDPWRAINRDRFERGRFTIQRRRSYQAAIELRSGAIHVSEAFTRWYRSTT